MVVHPRKMDDTQDHYSEVGSMSGSHLEELDLFYQEVRKANSRPLWMMGGDNLTTEPQPKTVAFVWKWEELRH